MIIFTRNLPNASPILQRRKIFETTPKSSHHASSTHFRISSTSWIRKQLARAFHPSLSPMREVVVTRLLHPFIILAKSDRPSITLLTVVMTPSFSILVEMSQPTIRDDDGAIFGIIHFSGPRGRIKITLRRVTLEKKKPPTHKF